MEPDLLQQLRDIHLPAEPTWWPPAPGWWLLALASLGLLLWVIRLLRRAWQRRRPIKLARHYYDGVYTAYQRGEIDAPTYLHETNELLKRLYIHGLHDDEARRLNDDGWLAYLDTRSGGNAFTQGPGRQLSNQRFSPKPGADPELLHPLVADLFKAARP